jgi:hypothetical protein
MASALPPTLARLYALAHVIPARIAAGKDPRPVARVYFETARKLLGYVRPAGR